MRRRRWLRLFWIDFPWREVFGWEVKKISRQAVYRLLWLMLTALALGLVVYQAHVWSSAAARLDGEIRSTRPAVGGALNPPGGVFMENDSLAWLGYANRIASGDTWRVRGTLADNTPDGRAVHWSQSVSWILVALAKVRQELTREGIRPALEAAAVWMNPLLQGTLVVGLGLALFRRIGAIPAGLFALFIATSSNIGFSFHALRPDHQGLLVLFGIFSVAGIVLGGGGWMARRAGSGELSLAKPLDLPDNKGAGKYFFASGVAAGLGLWVSAATQGILLVLIFLAAVLVVFFAAPSSRTDAFEARPERWRRWGWVCGGTSFFLYLLEYFPNHLGMRLEVNHPLYSVLAISMGEALCQFMRFRHAGGGRRALAWGVVFTALALGLPLIVILGPAEWHAMRDPHMFRLHKFIEEFQSFPQTAGSGYPGKYFRDFGILPVFFLVAFGSLFFSTRERPAIGIALLVALGVLGLAWLQVRWLGLADLLNVFLAAVAGTWAWRRVSRLFSGRPRLVFSVLLCVLLALQPLFFMVGFYRYMQPVLTGAMVPQNFIYPLMAKRIALSFRDLAGPGARVMASPSIAPALQYFADASVVSSLYWENRAGLDAALEFFTDEDGGAARRIARERGLTHILLLPEKDMARELFLIKSGRVDEGAARRMLYSRLVGGLNVPAWTATDAATKAADSRIYFYRGKPLQGRCRIYKIAADSL